MRHQEPKPTAWMPSARDPETWTSNDPRPHCNELYYLQPVCDGTSRRYLPGALVYRHNKTSEQSINHPLV